jgi:hypothetical protein
LITALVLAVGLIGVNAGCGALRRTECPTETAVFPFSGTVVKKERVLNGCYLIYAAPTNASFTKIIRVNFLRYANTPVGSTVMYATSGAAKE